jgi:transcriptional regulator with XRE-family HTH domain
MKKINVSLNFDAIRERIEEYKKDIRPGVWADRLGVSVNVVSNIHGKTRQKPSLEYIIAVSQITGKSVDYFLWGKEIGNDKVNNNFKIPQKGQDAINALLEIENIDEQTFRRTVADLEFIATKLKEGATPSPLIEIPENKTLEQLTKEKDRI